MMEEYVVSCAVKRTEEETGGDQRPHSQVPISADFSNLVNLIWKENQAKIQAFLILFF